MPPPERVCSPLILSRLILQKLFPLLAFLSVHLLSAQVDTSVLADGPYLMYDDNDRLTAYWTDPEARTSSQAVWAEDVVSQLPAFRTFRPELVNKDTVFHRSQQVTFTGVDKLAIVSDIHGQYEVIRKLLISHGIMDERRHWTFGEGHFVIVGDIFDRGGQVTEILWMIHNLQQEALAAGGRVHFLLGNHETMIMDGDIRYINKRYLTTGALLQIPYQELYGPDSYLGRWLRSLPLTVQINDMVFVHGGFSTEMVRKIYKLGKINDLYHQHLIDNVYGTVAGETEELQLMKGRQGPLWYRGYFTDRDLDDKDLAKILKKLKAGRMVVGHTSFEAIRSFFDGKVIAVDSSMKFGSMGEVLLVEDGHFVRGNLLGERVDLFEAGR